MVSWAKRLGPLALIGIMGFGAVACSGSHSASTSTATGPIVNMGIPDQDFDSALSIVEEAFGGCAALDIDVMGGSTVFPPSFAEKVVLGDGRMRLTGQAVRAAHNPLVVELRQREMFLVELDPAGLKGAAPFNDRAEAMLGAARVADDGCGSVATSRYAYRGASESG